MSYIQSRTQSVESKFEVIFLTGGDGEDGMREIFFIGGNGEDGMRVKHLSLDFTECEALKCRNAFPWTFAMSTYYVPDSNFFCVDRLVWCGQANHFTLLFF